MILRSWPPFSIRDLIPSPATATSSESSSLSEKLDASDRGVVVAREVFSQLVSNGWSALSIISVVPILSLSATFESASVVEELGFSV